MSTAVHPVVLQNSAQEVLVQLVRLSIADDGSDGKKILEQLTQLAATGLGVARASVWLMNKEQDTIVCQDLFDGSTHSSNLVLARKNYPVYFSELDRGVVIPAENAHTHPATAGFSDSYLTPLGIGAMLDAPIWRGGKPVGVLCLEHIGDERLWSEGDQAFATQVALICGIYYERQARIAVEIKLREQQDLEHANQKMEALGRMACTVGHDFNNLLTTIVGQIELIKLEAKTEKKIEQRADVVLDAAERASALVKRLLNFGKGRKTTVAEIDVVKVIQDMEAVLRSSIPKRIFLDITLPSNPMLILADTVSVEQVIMNLVINARDAIDSYGSITISVSRGVDDDGNSSVVLKISDSGKGMDDNTLVRAFDPFFSTKGKDGTGLGLSTCFSNMRGMGGRINITSNVGQGTTCTCTFPSLVANKN